jgi:hypothetical protein
MHIGLKNRPASCYSGEQVRPRRAKLEAMLKQFNNSGSEPLAFKVAI